MASENGSGRDAGVKVLLVVADPLTREVLSMALADTGFQVHAEPDGLRVERIVAAFAPDIALIDLDLRDTIDGVSVAKRVRACDPVPILILTAVRDLDRVLANFDTGGHDYVVKPFVMDELAARMRAVLRRSGHQPRRASEVGDLVVDEGAHSAIRGGVILDLTHREFSLLAMLGQHPGIVLSKARLLREVWSHDHFDVNVVEVHVSALRRKLEEHGPRLIHTVRGVGYVLRPTSARVTGAAALARR